MPPTPRNPLSVSHYFCVIEGRRIAVQIVSTVPDSFWSQGSVHADFSTSGPQVIRCFDVEVLSKPSVDPLSMQRERVPGGSNTFQSKFELTMTRAADTLGALASWALASLEMELQRFSAA